MNILNILTSLSPFTLETIHSVCSDVTFQTDWEKGQQKMGKRWNSPNLSWLCLLHVTCDVDDQNCANCFKHSSFSVAGIATL